MRPYVETPRWRRELGLVALLSLGLWPLASFAASGRGIVSSLIVVALCIAGAVVIRLVPCAAGALAGRTLMPVAPGLGRAQPPALSLATAHEARGEVRDAMETVEMLLRGGKLEVGARFDAAELLARHGRPARAAEVLQEIRALRHVGVGERLRASNRLVDLYLGPLADRDRAVRELRRIVREHAGSAAAAGAERFLAELRAERAGAAEPTRG